MSASDLTVDEKVTIITRNLHEVMGGDVTVGKLRDLISQRQPKVYWGTAPTGAPHIAYFVPMTKIADLLRAGCKVTILFADLHAYLDNQKAPWELLKYRTSYYEAIIKEMLKAIGVSTEQLRFVRGTEYQLSKEYTTDMFKLCANTTNHLAKKAGAEVVKQSVAPCVSGMLYPLLQTLDEQYLSCDLQFGGVDQRKIFTLAEDSLPSLSYGKRIHLMNAMIPGLTGAKMSSSELSSKIDILDSPESVTTKLNGACCPAGVVEGNGVLAFCKMVLFAASKREDQGFIVKTIAAGEEVVFKNYEELEGAFVRKEVLPDDLKSSMTLALNELLAPIRAAFSTPEMQALVANAYPKEDVAASMMSSSVASSTPESSSSPSSSVGDRVKLITRNLVEVMGADDSIATIQTIVAKRPLRVTWCTSTTDSPDVTYFAALNKIVDFLRAGCEVTVRLGDLHAYLDSQKATWELLDARAVYYELTLREMLLASINDGDLPLDRLKFVRGSEYQLSRDYTLDMYRLSTLITDQDACAAGAEVVKQNKFPCVSSLLYPILQALDEEHLRADVIFGDVTQRKMFELAERCLPLIGHTKRVHLLSPAVPVLVVAKAPMTEQQARIDVLDTPEQVKAKVKKAFCPEGEVHNNVVLSFIKLVLFGTISKQANVAYMIRRPVEYGGDVSFKTYGELEAAYVRKEVFPGDLKNSVVDAINELLAPIRATFAKEELVKIIAAAYPPPQVKGKQVKTKAPKPSAAAKDDASSSNAE